MQRLATPLLLVASVVLLAGVAVAGIELVDGGPSESPTDDDTPVAGAGDDAADDPSTDDPATDGATAEDPAPDETSTDESSTDDSAADDSAATDPGDPSTQDGGEGRRDRDGASSQTADGEGVTPSSGDPGGGPNADRQATGTGDTPETRATEDGDDHVVAALPHTGGPPATLLGLLGLGGAATLRRRTISAWQ